MVWLQSSKHGKSRPKCSDIITYFNEDPIDLTTDLPKNDGWKKYFEFTHILVKDQSTLYNIHGAKLKVHGIMTS